MIARLARAPTVRSSEDVYWLKQRGIDVIVPIADSDDRLVGALLLGEKKSEQPYSDGDSRFLSAVARQTAVIRENLRLRARLTEEVRVRHDVLARLDGSMPDRCLAADPADRPPSAQQLHAELAALLRS